MHPRWLPQETLRRKRDGKRLTQEELSAVAVGLADGSLDDAQAAAFAMAVFFRGMQAEECAQFTWAMRDSGDVFDWTAEGLPGPVLDKHSTGGVGDLVSLPLGPMLAACGAFVPMISGRGLGHTGGTLDKLDAIPGYQVRQGAHRLKAVLREAGVFIVGAGDRLAPADRRLYAIRDVTATVDCVPLITASILSKKLAAGLQALVLDVKTGNGAVMPALARSRELAHSLVHVAAQAGLPTVALLTDMSQPLARSAGNALELRETLGILRGEPANPRLLEVTLALGAALLCRGGLDPDEATARRRLQESLASGGAAERFARMVAALGGPADFLERPDAYLTPAPVVHDVPAPRAGWIAGIDTRALGLAVVALGGGRTHPDQHVDPRVGLDRIRRVGEAVAEGEPLVRVHAADAESAAQVAASIQEAVSIAQAPPPAAPGPVIGRMDAASHSV
jgi:thymidine phosphorylase